MADQNIDPAVAIEYWASKPATLHDIMGGLPELSDLDLVSSHQFIRQVRADIGLPESGRFKSALDCGAGIGRVSSGLLLKIADRTDAVEPVSSLSAVMREDDKFEAYRASGQLGRVWTCGLQQWPTNLADSVWRSEGDIAAGPAGSVTELGDRQYDLVWVQWCIGHLKDSEVVDLFARLVATPTKTAVTDSNSKAGQTTQLPILAPNGLIVVKENVTRGSPSVVYGKARRRPRLGNPISADVFSEPDSSITRTKAKFLSLFDQAGLEIVREELQPNFPTSLFRVWSWALQPKRRT